jgi:hypothetical protein
MFGSFHFGSFRFLYFDHFSCVIFFTMCFICLFLLACLALEDKQKIMWFFLFVFNFVDLKRKTKNGIKSTYQSFWIKNSKMEACGKNEQSN